MPLPKGIKIRPYQEEHFRRIREALRSHKAVLAEAPTGSGKSVLMSLIVDSFQAQNRKWKKDRHLYFLSDEKFLLYQFSDHLTKWEIPHDIIGDGKREGRAVNVHVCTIQTLAKLRPKNAPSFFVVDEAHFSAAARYMNLFYAYPDAKILGLTASPEQGSGKGLRSDWSACDEGPINMGPGIFDVLVSSPVTMREMTEGIEVTDDAGVTSVEKYLVPIRYFGPPIKGIENLHIQHGDYKSDEVEALLRARGTYGDAVAELKKFPQVSDHILFFCRTVAACYDMATVLHSHGYTAEVLEGAKTRRERRAIMRNFEKKATQILVTCRMILKGVDIPNLRAAVDLAPSPSRGILRQKIGRGTREAPGKNEFIYLDMVGNHRCLPGSDIYADIDWNFASGKFNKKPVAAGDENVCPMCYALIPAGRTECPECGAAKRKPEKREKPGKHMDGDLVEIVPVPLAEREQDDRDAANRQITAALRDGDIDALIKIGRTITSKKKLPFWVYHQLNRKKNIVDVELLYRIQRALGYRPGWAFFARQTLRDRRTA